MRALAVVGAGQVLADGVDAAHVLGDVVDLQALVQVRAGAVGAADEAAAADAGAAHAGLARIRRAVAVGGADPPGCAVALLGGVTGGATGALADEGADGVDADCAGAARVAGALIHVDAGAAARGELESWQALAHRHAAVHKALRVGEAGGGVARV